MRIRLTRKSGTRLNVAVDAIAYYAEIIDSRKAEYSVISLKAQHEQSLFARETYDEIEALITSEQRRERWRQNGIRASKANGGQTTSRASRPMSTTGSPKRSSTTLKREAYRGSSSHGKLKRRALIRT
jgi:hypothetical protein